MDETEYDPYEFASEAYAKKYHQCFDAYVELRVRGFPREAAVIEAFELIQLRVSLHNVNALGLAADVNPYVKARYSAALASKDVKTQLWTANESVNQLLRLVRDPHVKDNTRLNAIVHLNVMCGYIQLDELTERRIGKTIADFQRQHAAWQAAGSPTTPQAATTH
jgi:hypothetical protein